MQLPLVLLSILGVAVATPVDFNKFNEDLLVRDGLTKNSALENLIHGLIEDFRKTMLTGSDDVPVLDPLEIERLYLNEDALSLPGSHVDIKNLVVSKLSTFVVDKLTVNSASIIPDTYRIEFDIHVPVLELLADNYDLLLSEQGTNIFGNGDAKIDLIEPRVKGSIVVVTIDSGLFLQIISSHVQVSLKSFESVINGLMNDPGMSEIINTNLKHFVPKLLESHEDEITKFLSDTVQEIGNELLADSNVSGILGTPALSKNTEYPVINN